MVLTQRLAQPEAVSDRNLKGPVSEAHYLEALAE
jgi:hypothetical protein